MDDNELVLRSDVEVEPQIWNVQGMSVIFARVAQNFRQIGSKLSDVSVSSVQRFVKVPGSGLSACVVSKLCQNILG